MPRDNDFELKLLTTNQMNEILDFIGEHFVPYEAISQGLHATAEDIYDFNKELLESCLPLEHSLSLIDRDSGKIAGICINKILTPDQSTTFDLGKNNNNEKIDALRSLLTKFDSVVNLFEDPNLKKVLECALISVDKSFAGKGVSYRLIQESEKLAKASGCTMAFVQTTGLGSQHIFLKSGYKIVGKINYSDVVPDNHAPLDASAMLGSKFCLVYKKSLEE